ncbi:methionyl-tRNA formyltransferase [Gammaproteobacteria bacterium]|nr:methionyl-tRNA formyltransferase [Gammaproteobacteria bacterium]
MPNYKKNKPDLKVGFAGTPEFACASMAALHDAFGLVLVISQPDRRQGRGKKLLPSPVKSWSTEQHIPVITPEKIRQSFDEIQAAQLDLLVVAAYGQIIPQRILDLPRLGCLNIHGSILPRFRGASPIASAIAAGDKETGISYMYMTKGMDEGPVYRIETINILAHDTTQSLTNRLADLSQQTIVSAVKDLENTTPQPQPNDGIVYAPRLSKQDGMIDWQQPATVIERHIRAFYPWPKAFSVCGKRLMILEAQVAQQNHQHLPGTVIKYSANGLWIAAGNQTCLQITKCQNEHQKPLPIRAFFHGNQKQFIPLQSRFDPINSTS